VADVVIGVVGAVLVAWLALVAYLWISRPDDRSARKGLRLLPDILRLLRRVAGDRSVGRGVRVRLWFLLAYLALPIDVVPDVIPVIGYADDLLIAAAGLRSVVRRAGPDVLREHWPGTTEGLEAVWRLARLPGTP
jgi:uncharacterized membrane protein YkvA (DUF1232 family)